MNVAARREKALEEFWEVKILADLLSWVKNAPVRQGWPRLRIQETFLELQSAIGWKDPIVYLHKLYYEDQKSLDEILITPEINSIDFFPKATLNRHLFGKFWWVARSNTERTSVHEEKLNEKIEWEIAEFEQKVDWLLWGRKIVRAFKNSEFESKAYRAWKALYVLKTLGWIDKNSLYKLSVDGWLSNAILAKSLNKELEKILLIHPDLKIDFEDIKLYPQSIARWVTYYSDNIETPPQ
jgi:hypothetical protein